MQNPSVYISYSYTEKEIAQRLARDLPTQGIQAIWDDILRPGDDWRKVLWDEALPQASSVIVLVSPRSSQSKNVYFEVQYALRTQRRVLPVLVDGDYSLLQEFGLADVIAPRLQNMEESYDELLALLIKWFGDFFTEIRGKLLDSGFSPRFVNSLHAMGLETQRTTLTLYYDGNINFTQATSVEARFNRLAFEVMQSNADLRHIPLIGDKILTITDYGHPNSTQIVIDFVAEVAGYLGDESTRAIYLGLITNAFYDVLKASKRGFLFAASKINGGDWKEQEPNNLSEDEEQVAEEVETAVAPVEEVTTSSESFYVIMRGGDVIVAWQSEKVVRSKTRKLIE